MILADLALNYMPHRNYCTGTPPVLFWDERTLVSQYLPRCTSFKINSYQPSDSDGIRQQKTVPRRAVALRQLFPAWEKDASHCLELGQLG